jgi:class 3 adenylate cyclase
VVLALLPIWAVCFGLGLRSLAPTPLLPLGVRAAPDGGYPILIDIAPWGDSETGLRRGDQLVRLGDTELRGMHTLGFYAHFAAEVHSGEPPPRVVYERGGERGETHLPTLIFWRRPLLLSLGFAFVAFVLAFRAAPSPLTRSLSRASLVAAVATVSPITGGVALNYVGLAVGAVAWSLIFPLSLRALLLLLHSKPASNAWTGHWPWLFASAGPLVVSNFASFPLGKWIGVPLMLLVFLAFLVVILVLVARGYHSMDAVERRQMRWLALGCYAGLTPAITVTALLLIDGFVHGEWRRFQPLLDPSYSFGILIPLSFLLATGRYNRFDVDRLLSATASYNLLLIALLGGALVVVPRVAEVASSLVGIDPGTGQVALSLALAALVVPTHQRLRPQIDRLFFRERYALDKGIGELLPALAACADARELTQRVGEGLHRLFRPEACVVYAAVGEGYLPIFVEGRAVPPAFAASSLLVHALLERRVPLSLSDAGRQPDDAALGPFDRAALQTLEAEVVVPVRRDALVAFVCLGPKRSGDVYTSTDLSLLTVVAETASRELRRFEQDEVVRQAREMQDSLRRYVPGAVVAQLSSGAALDSSERQISVLFVDIRGYTSFAESRRAEEIFSTVNRYTDTVSSIVRAHGGWVVEFNGDGLMAVFGAPADLPDKEREAVEAAREIISAVATLPVADATDPGAKLSAGVGIATGEAWVGNIQTADRMIWSAIGNTTNLAARLQSLTRELEAAIAVDAATHSAASDVCADFERHPEIRLRGRREPRDVWALPLRAS